MSTSNVKREPIADHVPDVGDIIWLDAGPTTGHEQDHYRPWVVMSERRFNENSGLAFCVPCTTTIKHGMWEVPVDGLPEPTSALWAHGRTLAWKKRQAEHFGEKASAEVMKRLRIRIGSFLQIPMVK